MVVSMQEKAAEGTSHWERCLTSGEAIVKIIQQRGVGAETLTSQAAYDQKRSESEEIQKRYERILAKLYENVDGTADVIMKLAADAKEATVTNQPPAEISVKAEETEHAAVALTPEEEQVQLEKSLKSLAKLAKLLPKVARTHFVNTRKLEKRIRQIDESLLSSSTAEIEFAIIVHRSVPRERVRSVCSVFCGNQKDNAEGDTSFKGGFCNKCYGPWRKITYFVPGCEEVFESVYDGQDIGRINSCESDRQRLETARSILQSKVVVLKKELLEIRQYLPEFAVFFAAKSKKKTNLFREYMLPPVTQNSEKDLDELNGWTELQNEYDKDFEDIMKRVGEGVRSAWNSVMVNKKVERLEKFKFGGSIITYFIANSELHL